MDDLRRRSIAKVVPIVSVAGRAGGTTMVIRSRALTSIVCHLIWNQLRYNEERTPMRTNCTAEIAKPNKAMIASTPMKFIESRLLSANPKEPLTRI
jgi:hypothetical protein